MDEQLITEVQKHSVIYNRQKYFLTNNMGPEKYESKDDAWETIALSLGTDVNTCKKRWKYLRERYVQQRKQGDPPTYEHLSRPYLEKMKFLDQHIQPRKSYRNVSNFLPSPNGNVPFQEFMDSSRSDGSFNNNMVHIANFAENLNGSLKMEPEQSFGKFSPLAHHHPHHSHHSVSHSSNQSHHVQQSQQQHPLSLHTSHSSQPSHPVPPTAGQPNTSSSNHQPLSGSDFREAEIISSSSSSLKSPLSSPQTVEHPDHRDHADPVEIKRPRIENNGPMTNVDSSDGEDQQDNNINNHSRQNSRISQYSNDILYSLFQQFPQHRQFRSSEHLLGELVTTELLKMSRERRKTVQRRILEILFFDD